MFTSNKSKNSTFTVAQIVNIEASLKELVKRRTHSSTVSWDIVSNIKAAEPTVNLFEETRMQVGKKYEELVDGKPTGKVSDANMLAFKEEINKIADKQIEISFAPIPVSALVSNKNKSNGEDEELYTDLLVYLEPIVKR